MTVAPSYTKPCYKKLVARGNDWQPGAFNDSSSMVTSFPPPINVKQKKIWLKNEILYYYSLTDWLLGATIGNHGHSVIDI